MKRAMLLLYSGAEINPLPSLNPSDIDSIDVFKDAFATAIYGSHGPGVFVTRLSLKNRIL